MSEMQGTLFEFDQKNELHRKAQHYIETMDREKFPSFGDLMITAIVDYFDRYYEQEAGENKAAQMDLDARIEAAVEHALESKLPEILAPVLEKAAHQADEDDSQELEEKADDHVDLESVKQDINWGFLGG